MAPLSVDVVLLSGQSARIFGDPDLTIQELRQNAQQQLGVKLLDLFLGHKRLEPWSTLKDLDQLENGQVVSASVWQPKLCSSRHSDSFAFITDDGILFGDPLVAPMERLELTDVRDVRMSADAFAALRADGSVHCWGGFFSGGHLGAMRQELYQVRQLEASQRAFGALRADGRVVTWGDVVFGGDSSEVADELVEVSCLKASRRAFAAIVGAARSVVTWGDGAFGGDCSAVQDQLVDVVQLHATERAFAALTACGRVVTWGDAIYGGVCPAALQKGKVLMIQASQRAFAAYSKELGVVSWGDPDFGGDSRFINLGHGHILEMEATAGAFAALLDTGTVLCWGHHDLGGHLSDETRELLVQQQRLHRLVASNGAFVALGETDLVSWGNHFGGADLDACASLSKVEDLQGSASSFMALSSDGALITWGRGIRNGFVDHEHLRDEWIPEDEDLEVPNIDGVENHDDVKETLDATKGLKKDLAEAKSF